MKNVRWIAQVAVGVMLSAGVNVYAEEGFQHYKLSDRREKITFPAYTPEQREAVAKQAQFHLRDLFTHREYKIATHGKEVDPVPAIEKLIEKSRDLKDQEFHRSLSQIFLSQRDLHTNYFYPTPHACYRSVLPFGLVEYVDANSKPAVGVRTITTLKEILDLSPGAEKINVGDQLIRIQDQDVFDYMKALEPLGAGANVAASRLQALRKMTSYSQRLHDLPTTNDVSLKFRRPDGEEYSLTLPWIARENLACLGQKVGKSKSTKRAFGNYDEHFEYQEIFRPQQELNSVRVGEEQELDPILHYRKTKIGDHNYGILVLDEFAPAKLTEYMFRQSLKKLLEQANNETDGLIIDLRNNPGGYIDFGEELVALFTTKKQLPNLFRARASELNRSLGGLFDIETAVEKALKDGKDFTEPALITSEKAANANAGIYKKPFAVLVNSGCYSTCDMFTAMVQDSEAALIFSDDGYTGGGGANVVEHNAFLFYAPENTLKKLPAGQNMRVAWRQTIRQGKNKGVILEGPGVKADVVLPPQLKDLTDNSSEQFKKIAEYLSKKS